MLHIKTYTELFWLDFDEQTADDWDVDMSIYEDPEAGDKDARDYIAMRREKRIRDGTDPTDLPKTGIGKFEKHTKVSCDLLKFSVNVTYYAKFKLKKKQDIVKSAWESDEYQQNCINFIIILLLVFGMFQ